MFPLRLNDGVPEEAGNLWAKPNCTPAWGRLWGGTMARLPSSTQNTHTVMSHNCIY